MRLAKLALIFMLFSFFYMETAFAVPDGSGSEVFDSESATPTTTSVLKLKNSGSAFESDIFVLGADPTGSVNGSVGDLAIDTTGTGAMYLNTTGGIGGWSTIVTGSSATTLQDAYDNDAGAPTDITLTATDGGISLSNGGGAPLVAGSMFTINQSNAAASAIPMTITNTGPTDAFNITHSSGASGDVFQFSADGTLGGSDDMIMDLNGNVGIGGTPDSAAATLAKLKVYSSGTGTPTSIMIANNANVRFLDTAGTTTIGSINMTATTENFIFANTSTTGTAQNIQFNTPSNVLFSTGGSEKMRVDASGNVGIGTSTIATTGLEMGASKTIGFEGSTADASETVVTAFDPTADRTITLPNATGTVPLYLASTFNAADTIANNAAKTAFTSTITIPAGALNRVGAVLAIDFGGVIDGLAAGTIIDNIEFVLNDGADRIIITAPATTMGIDPAANGWMGRAVMRVTTAGASGAVRGWEHGVLTRGITAANQSESFQGRGAGAVAVNLTGTLTLKLFWDWNAANAANTVTLEHMSAVVYDGSQN